MKSFVLPVPPDSRDFEIVYGDLKFRVCETSVCKTCPKFAEAIASLPRSIRTFAIPERYYLTNPSSVEVFFSILEGKPVQITNENAKDLEFLSEVWAVEPLKWAANDFIKTSLLERALEQNRLLEGQVRLLRQELEELRHGGAFSVAVSTAPVVTEPKLGGNRLMADGEDYVEEEAAEAESEPEQRPAPAQNETPSGEPLIAKLWTSCGGNPALQGAVVVTGSSYNFVHWQNLVNLLDPKWEGFWTSQKGEGACLQWDFVNQLVRLTGYSLKTFKGDPGAMHLKSWVLEGYRDGDWVVLDERKNCELLNAELKTATFQCATVAVVSQIKLKMVGKNWAGSKQMFLTNVEFFGEFVDK